METLALPFPIRELESLVRPDAPAEGTPIRPTPMQELESPFRPAGQGEEELVQPPPMREIDSAPETPTPVREGHPGGPVVNHRRHHSLVKGAPSRSLLHSLRSGKLGALRPGNLFPIISLPRRDSLHQRHHNHLQR